MADDPFATVMGIGRGDSVVMPGSSADRLTQALRALWDEDLDPPLALLAAHVQGSPARTLFPPHLKALAMLVARPLADLQHQRWGSLIQLVGALGLRPPEVAVGEYLAAVEHDIHIALNSTASPSTALASETAEGAAISRLASIAALAAAEDSARTAERYIGHREWGSLQEETAADIGVSASSTRARMDGTWWSMVFRGALREHLTDGKPLDVARGFNANYRGAAIKLAEEGSDQTDGS